MKAPALLLAAFLLCSCKHAVTPASRDQSSIDTIVVKTESVQFNSVDSARIVHYCVLAGKDSTGFECSASERTSQWYHGQVSLSLSGRYSKPISFRQELHYFGMVLAYIAKDFRIDSVRTISMSSIAGHPDLAVALSLEYQNQFGKLAWVRPDSLVRKFLDTSVIVKAIQPLFSPYGLKLKRTQIEKFSLSSGTAQYLNRAAMETDTTKIPEKVFDGALWIDVR